jgi:hypothetical protein
MRHTVIEGQGGAHIKMSERDIMMARVIALDV